MISVKKTCPQDQGQSVCLLKQAKTAWRSLGAKGL
jgi:hypothetical protein